MHKLLIIGLILTTAGLVVVATLNNIISHAMAQESDNRTGTQGLPGPSQILSTNTYVNQTTRTVPGGTGEFSNDATCDNGDTILGGGASVSSATTASNLRSTALITVQGWDGSAHSATWAPTTLSTFAVCFDNPPLRP